MAMIMPRALRGTAVLKFAFGAFTALFLAGCSDSIERFSENYSNPSDQDPVYTASVPRYVKKKPVKQWEAPQNSADDQISETPIAPRAPYQPKVATNDYASSYQQPVLQAPAAQAPVYVAPKYQPPKLAYKAPAAPADPTYDNPAPAPKMATAAPRLTLPAAPAVDDTAQVADAGPSSKVTMKPGMTLYGLARSHHLTVQQLASANNIKPPYVVPLGRVLTIPAAPAATAVAKPVAAKDESQIADNSNQITDDNAKQASTPMIKKPAPLALPKEPAADVATTETPVDANPQLALRWPLRGKIISGFGPKQNGLKNEGINIAVPEGTNIQAAEGGVVAYAGNELKGYGNLVLIRHEGGYVTAYAHAAKLLVKKGDVVKRGAVIAVAGQTGAVQSPQLHFEVRKGATALDPQKFLASSTAMN